MNFTTILALFVLGIEVIAFYFLWRTNQRLITIRAELRAEIDERCRLLNERIDQVRAEMQESIQAANQRIDETIEAHRLLDDLDNINDRVQCLRSPNGLSKRVRRSDHRQ